MANAVYTLSSATVLGGPSAGGGDVADALSSGASLDGVFSFKEVSAPSGTADYAKIYAADDGGTSELYAMDSAGNPTKLT